METRLRRTPSRRACRRDHVRRLCRQDVLTLRQLHSDDLAVDLHDQVEAPERGVTHRRRTRRSRVTRVATCPATSRPALG